MKVKFKGFKEAPFRDHIVVLIGVRHEVVSIGQTLEVPPEDGYRLLSTGEFTEVKEKADEEGEKDKKKGKGGSQKEELPPNSHRAITDEE